MPTPKSLAQLVRDEWTVLPVELPRPLTTALSLYEAVETLSPQPHTELPELSKMKPDQIEKLIFDVASQDVLGREFYLSPITGSAYHNVAPASLERAHQQVLEKLELEIIDAARTAAPAIASKLQPLLDEAVSRYAEAVDGLPLELADYESLVAAGPDAVAKFNAARLALESISEISTWIYWTQLDSTAPAPSRPLLAPRDADEHSALREVPCDSWVLSQIDPASYRAIQLGTPWKVQTYAQASAREAELSTELA